MRLSRSGLGFIMSALWCLASSAVADTNGVVARYTALGTLETTFLPTNPNEDDINGVVLDGTKIVTCGTLLNSNGIRNALVARLKEDLTADPAFGFFGVTSIPWFDSLKSPVCMVDTQHRVIVAAVADSSGGYLLARFTETGSLDAAFGNQGTDLVFFAGFTGVASIAFVPGNKFVVTGRRPGGGGYAVVHGNTGSVERFITSSVISNVTAAYAENNGQIVLAGTDNSGFLGVAQRFNLVDGSPDPGFGPNGNVPLGFNEPSLARDTDTRYVFAGTNFFAPVGVRATRIKADGTPDAGFGNNGTTDIPFAGGTRQIRRANGGKFIVNGNIGSPSRFFVMRLDSSGALDKKFGNQGIVTTSFGQPSASASGLAVDAAGRPIVVGLRQ